MVCFVTATVGLAIGAHGQTADGVSAGRAAGHWLASRQFPNGAFFAENGSALGTGGAADAVLSLVASGAPPDVVTKGLSYVTEKSASEATAPGQISRLVMALAAGGRNPRDVRGVDYVDSLSSFLKPSGAYDENNVYSNSLVLLGLAAAREPTPQSALDYIRRNQCAGGGFSWQPGCLRTPDMDTTALTIGAMVANGISLQDGAISRARLFLLASQDPSGGFGYEATKPVNANSTALALTAIAAIKESPRASQWDMGNGKDPLSALLALQESSGAFRYEALRDDDSRNYATIQAILGSTGTAYPVIADAPVSSAGTAAKATSQIQTASNASTSSAPEDLKPSVLAEAQPAAPSLAARPVQTTRRFLASPSASDGGPAIKVLASVLLLLVLAGTALHRAASIR